MWSNPKVTIWRSERYLDAVRRLQICVCCGHHGNCQAAHLGGVGQGKGMGLKVADSMAASLCSVQPDKESWKEGCHEEWDQRKGQFAGLDFEQAELLAHLFIAKTMMMLLEAGDLVPVASSRR